LQKTMIAFSREGEFAMDSEGSVHPIVGWCGADGAEVDADEAAACIVHVEGAAGAPWGAFYLDEMTEITLH